MIRMPAYLTTATEEHNILGPIVPILNSVLIFDVSQSNLLGVGIQDPTNVTGKSLKWSWFLDQVIPLRFLLQILHSNPELDDDVLDGSLDVVEVSVAGHGHQEHSVWVQPQVLLLRVLGICVNEKNYKRILDPTSCSNIKLLTTHENSVLMLTAATASSATTLNIIK